MPDTLAQRVRAVHPGVYDDLSDSQLEAKVKAKYPGVYDDVPTTPPVAPESRSLAHRAADTVGDLVVGAAKGAANTVGGLGDLARKIPGVSALDKLMTPIPVNTTPSNTTQRVGFGAEQLGEFFVPIAGEAGAAAKAVKVGKSGVLTLAQGGSPLAAGVSAGVTALVPGASAAAKASGALRDSAEKTIAQALGATKEAMKTDAAKLAPQMLDRGVRGTRAAMLDEARRMAASVGQQLNAAYETAASAGHTVSAHEIRGVIQAAREGLTVQNAAGLKAVIPGTERVIQKLERLDEFVGSLGDDIPVDRAAAVKRTWDHIVSKAGLFGPKATASATDSADAWAIREASNAFRDLLNKNPTLGELNHEAAFWMGLKKVLTATQQRTQAQAGGLVSGITGAAGAASGFASGDSMSDRVQNAVLGGIAGRQLVKAIQSPWWRTTAAGPVKNLLAEALASESSGRAIGVLSKITQALPSQLTQPVR